MKQYYTVLSAPYCSNLTAGRNRVAWAVTTEDTRNIWTAAIAGGEPTQLTRNTTDPGRLRQSDSAHYDNDCVF